MLQVIDELSTFNVTADQSEQFTPLPIWNETDYISNSNWTWEDVLNEEDYYSGLFEISVNLVYFFCVLYGFITAVAVIGNAVLLFVVITSSTMWKKCDIFIANMAIADVIIAVFTIPFQSQAALLQRWEFPHALCPICPFVQVLSVNVSVITLSAIAFERYRAIVHPLRTVHMPAEGTIWVTVFIWVLGILIALPQLVDYKVVDGYTNGGVKPVCTPLFLPRIFRECYLACLVVVQYFIPLVVIVGAYAKIADTLWNSNTPGNPVEIQLEVELRRKKKVIKMLVLMVLIFGICWLPLQLYNIIHLTVPSINEYHYINIIWLGFHWLAMSSSCSNPFIYALFSDRFRTVFRQYFLRRRQLPLPPSSVDINVTATNAETDL